MSAPMCPHCEEYSMSPDMIDAIVNQKTRNTEVAALVEALEAVALAAEPWPPSSGQVVARNPTARDWRDRLDDIHKAARAALALYRGEVGR